MIEKEAGIFGLLFLGDGATISRCPLLNILDSAKNIPVAVLEIIDCQGHLADGNKKDGTSICNRFLNQMKEIDPAKKISNIIQCGQQLFSGCETRILYFINYWVWHNQHPEISKEIR